MRKPLIVWLFLCMAAYPAVEPEFHIPFEKFKLANGLRVILSRDTSLPVIAVYMVYDVGARSEDKGSGGFALLLEHMMFDGSANVKKGEHAGYVHSNGGELNGTAHLDYTDFYDVLPSNRLALALWLEADRMRSLAITEDNLRIGKETVQQEKRRVYEGQPYRGAIADKWAPLIFSEPHNTRSAMASADDLAAATVDSVATFFRTWYAPNNAVLTISGDFAAADARKMVEQYFGDIASQPQPPRPALSEPARAEGKTLTVPDPLARVPAGVIGWPAPKRHTPDWYALYVLDAMLTAGRSSKLEMEMMKGRQSVLQVDENLGWPSATPLDFKDPGYFAAFLIYKPNFTPEDVVTQYQQVIDDIAANGIRATELRRVKAVMKLSKANGLQSSLERARQLGVAEVIDGDAGAVDRDYAGVLAVTAEQVQTAARKYLLAARRDVMIVRPAPGAAK